MFSLFREARHTWWRFSVDRKRSKEWRRVRREHLLEQPACMACGSEDHLQVHHIIPFHINPALELVHKNLITLCEKPGHDCHFVFGHFHNWKLYNPNVIEDANRYWLASLEARRRG